MPNLSTLRNSKSIHQAEQQNKQKLADDLSASARQHEESGDEARAKLDRDSASRYQAEADQAGSAATAIATEVELRERKQDEIQAQLEQLDKDYQSKRSSLQSELNKVA